MTEPAEPNRLTRRSLLIRGTACAAASASATAADGAHDPIVRTLPWQDGQGDAPPTGDRTGQAFFSAAERAFIVAAADRMIPADATGPSASEAGVVTFIDHQLAGAFGRGEHTFLGGPWFDGTPSQGPQQRQTPAAFYRTALAEIERWIARDHPGRSFATLDEAAQDTALKQLQDGSARLASVEPRTFFAMLLENVREGYFSDPIYGGNRGMAAWAMIGFPGARYDYSDWVDRHGAELPYPPVSLVGRADWSKR